MYNGYIIECPSMSDLFWEFVGMEYPDEPEELQAMSLNSLKKLNKHMRAINAFLSEVASNEDVRFSDYEGFIEYILDNYPSHIDRNVLNVYINNIETIVSLVTLSHDNELVLLDRFGSTAIITE